ncbi:hypothetical protein CO046_04240 [Candidatus Peregrinibacteria bacterium CG_4_9_14_0_2_um_filter_53_11]|nr:MAG: hypothetical protein CO046_04240 [Candidatus Peregrinibacteria bacterium CG_4_9_14_0_2_um_filter_53_11]
MLNLSWDLFVVVIFAVIVAYSFIIGKENTLKVIIGSYIAILTADGLGNLFQEYLLGSSDFVAFMRFMGITGLDHTMLLFKIIVFIGAIVILTIKGGFEIRNGLNMGGIIGLIINLVFGFLSAGLVISTLLIYVSGASFVEGALNIANNTLSVAYQDSSMIRLMIDNYNFWFALPAVAFLVTSLFNDSEA